MRPTQEAINNAKTLLANVKQGLISAPAALYNDWVYTATGKKSEKAPKDGPEFRVFFHLKYMPCALQLWKQVYHGFFHHEDNSPYYIFKCDDGRDMYFSGIGEFDGVMVFSSYTPKKLFLTARWPATKEIILANDSLTCSCL